MGLGGAGSHAVHPRWSQHHRPTATATMTATCVITRRDGAGTTSAGGAWTPSAPSTVYTGPCRVLAVTTHERVLIVGETQDTRRRYQVSIRYDANEAHIGDVVEVTESADPDLGGKKLRVSDISLGSEQWQRDLICLEMED